MKAEHIMNAITVLDRAYALFDKRESDRTPQEVGSMMAALYGARTDLEIFSGIRELEITVEKEAA
jgi:hypothetical protein